MCFLRLQSIVDLVYPRFCVGCGTDPLPPNGRWLCLSCLSRIEPLGPDPCPICGGDLGPGATPSSCPDCRRLHPWFDGVVAVGRYEGLLRDLVTRLKYGRDASLAWPLGHLLKETVRIWPAPIRPDLVVPVPMRFSKRWQRGFNQAELLAAEVARGLHLPLARLALRSRAKAGAQAGRSRTERLKARHGAFVARDPAATLLPLVNHFPGRVRERLVRWFAPRPRGKAVLLVDDVLTTGATASDAARALKEAGAREVLVAVAARA